MNNENQINEVLTIFVTLDCLFWGCYYLKNRKPKEL